MIGGLVLLLASLLLLLLLLLWLLLLLLLLVVVVVVVVKAPPYINKITHFLGDLHYNFAFVSALSTSQVFNQNTSHNKNGFILRGMSVA